MIKYKFIRMRFIIDKNIKIYENKNTKKLYCKNNIKTNNGIKTYMVSLNNYIKKKEKTILLKKYKKHCDVFPSINRTNITKRKRERLSYSEKREKGIMNKRNDHWDKKKIKRKSKREKGKERKRDEERKRYEYLSQRHPIIKTTKRGGGIDNKLIFEKKADHRKISIIMKSKKNPNVQLGHFTLNFSMKPYDLSVNIDEKYQAKGLSKVLLKKFLDFSNETKQKNDDISGNNKYLFNNGFTIKDSDNLVIDTDASPNPRGDSFWSYIGMKPNRYINSKNRIRNSTRGYEKNIYFKDLLTKIDKLTKPKKCTHPRHRYLTRKKIIKNIKKI